MKSIAVRNNMDSMENITNIIGALGELERTIVFPVHPRTKKLGEYEPWVPENVYLIKPPGYLDMFKTHERSGDDIDRFRRYSERSLHAGSAVH